MSYDTIESLLEDALLGLLGAALAPKGKKLVTGIKVGGASYFLKWYAETNPQGYQILIDQLTNSQQPIIAPVQAPLQLYDGISSVPELVHHDEQLVNVSIDPSLAKDVEDVEWHKVIPHPSIALLLGQRGSGKTAQGYRLLELFRYKLKTFVLGLPKKAGELLPSWIGIAQDFNNVPPRSVVLVDESYLRYNSRASLSQYNKELTGVLNLSRQREQTLIFISTEGRLVDINVVSAANVLLFKEPGILQSQFDRPELRKLIAEANSEFEQATGDKRRLCYVYSPETNHKGLLPINLPTFWKDQHSHLFALVGEAADARLPIIATKEELKQKVSDYHQVGMSLNEIADWLGIAKGTVYNYIHGYPYKKR